MECKRHLGYADASPTSFVARMSEAISGARSAVREPACRCAHAGYGDASPTRRRTGDRAEAPAPRGFPRPQAPFASIRGFLERMSHPLAAALISALNDIQRSQV